MSEFSYETFGGETVYVVRQSAEEQIVEQMLNEGFSRNIELTLPTHKSKLQALTLPDVAIYSLSTSRQGGGLMIGR